MNQSCQDFITHPSPSPSPYHIFFLPGNPGLVQYYAGFLSQLHEALNSSFSSPGSSAVSFPCFNVAGCSHAGFETGNRPKQTDSDDGRTTLYSITEQIDFSLERLRTYIQASSSSSDQKEKAKVILIGHSFGTFVIAEMLKRVFSDGNNNNNNNNKVSTGNDPFEIIGSILLFPPIPDLAESPRGKKLALIARWKYLPSIASYMAKLLCKMPLHWSNALIRHSTGLPSDALAVTRQFFGSRTGVAQTLYTANLELDAIKLTHWESAFRAIASARPTKQDRSKATIYIRIFFGKNDGWVSDDLRDAFMYKYCDDAGPRAFDAKREYLDISARIDPSVDGDEGSVVIPHDFATRHSEHVVPYVIEYVEEMVKANESEKID